MYSQKSMLNNRSVKITLAVVLVALVAGIYFAFKPFPAGPSIEADANVPEESGVKAVVPAGYAFESGAPLHYSGKVIGPGAASVPSSAIPPQYRRWFRFESGGQSIPSSAIPQHYIDAGYALKQMP
jgi:hypothetical protein